MSAYIVPFVVPFLPLTFNLCPSQCMTILPPQCIIHQLTLCTSHTSSLSLLSLFCGLTSVNNPLGQFSTQQLIHGLTLSSHLKSFSLHYSGLSPIAPIGGREPSTDKTSVVSMSSQVLSNSGLSLIAPIGGREPPTHKTCVVSTSSQVLSN